MNSKDLLSEFLLPVRREELNQIFSFKGWCISTNGVSLMAIYDEDLSEEFEPIEVSMKPFDLESEVKDSGFNLQVCDLPKLTIRDCKKCCGNGRFDYCPTCDGDGEVECCTCGEWYECKDCWGYGVTKGDKQTCDKCSGSGRISNPDHDYFEMLGSRFDIAYLYKIKEHLYHVRFEFPADDMSMVRYSHSRGLGFLMPMRKST